MATEVPSLLTVEQLATKHPAFKVGGLRWHIFHEDSNGLRESGAVVRLGRKVMLDEAKFLAWVCSNPSNPNPQLRKTLPKRVA